MANIAVYSVKGGVGKTTMAVNLAWCAASISCRRTLLWDMDAAGGAGFLLGVKPKRKRAAEGAFSRAKKPDKHIRSAEWPRLDLIPADESTRTLDRQFMQLGKKRRLAKIAASLSKDYERLIFDCPPVMNEVSAQIMRAADLVIVPLPPSPLSARALDTVAKEVATHSARPHPPILPVLSMVDIRRKLHQEAIAKHENWPVIPQASAAEQCAVHRAPIGAFAPNSAAAQAFKKLWTAIERKLADTDR